jgi:hypothetical protein
MDGIGKPGKYLFAIAVIGLGIENLICAHLAKGVVLPFIDGHPALSYFAGALLLASGLSIATNFRMRLAASVLAAFLLGCDLVFLLPLLIAKPQDIGIRTIVLETLSFAAVALVLAGTSASRHVLEKRPERLLGGALHLGVYLFAISCVIFGIDHFFIIPFIASLVPIFIPWKFFWAWFTGIAMTAAGISMAIRWMADWAGTLLGIMFLSWVLTLHGPRVARMAHNPDEWSSGFICLAMCGGSWVIASYFLARRRLI